MNGPDHYREAEKLLSGADHPDNHPDWAALSVAMAQVHATLALAAANAGQLMREHFEGEDDATAWAKATSPQT